ncbi:uncharacterized protein LOC113055372 [Carassius auratus]|uniref:Uncharacterized protein LOC113055372 n=1 Tax=Carassius auratus TaxID=7957 RepID=A0A6P6KYV4_CARAU|nr:uncharacterized protein LOC113055372 [Carassius auratus]
MHETHTGTHIADVLKAAVGEWNLDAKKPVVVTDNTSNMRVAISLTGYQHVRCFAHVLNLASQCALKIAAVAKVLVKVRRISTFFHRSTTGAEALKRNQELLGLPLHKLIVRWSSANEMISRFLDQQPAVLSPEVRKNVTDCALTENDISSAEEMVEAFRLMLVATNIMCEEKNPTISVVAPLHAQLLRDTTRTEEDSPLVREIKGVINQDLSKRYQSEVEKDLLRMSSALDPRFKSLLFLSPEEVQDTYAKLQSTAGDIISAQRSSLTPEHANQLLFLKKNMNI